MKAMPRILHAINRRFRRLWEPVVFRIRTLNGTGGYVRRKVLGSWMYLDVNDPGICRDLLISGIREEWAVRVMQQLLRPGQVIVDIGANIGYYVLLEAQRVGPTGKVFAIEPVPGNFELLQRNIRINEYSNIEMHNCAIGDYQGIARMYLSRRRNWHSMSAVLGAGTTIDVPLTTLDGFLEHKPLPSLVRMDVEGYEYEIVKGMRETMSRARELTLFIEIHPHILGASKTREFLETLAGHGFEVHRIANRTGELNLTIKSLAADQAAMDGRTGGFLVFFSKGAAVPA